MKDALKEEPNTKITSLKTAIIRVVIFNTKNDGFDYKITYGDIKCGMRVSVTLRGHKKIGIISHIYEPTYQPSYQVLDIDDIIDEQPIIPKELLLLCAWAKDYYQSNLSEAYKNIIPKRLRVGKALLPSNRLKKHEVKINQHKQEFLKLNDEQQKAFQHICKNLTAYHSFLLLGVTGSGKTEVYFHIMREVLNAQKNVLILVPEIGLTPQLIHRLSARFTLPMTIIHSKLSDGERHLAYFSCLTNQSRIIVGTRSAVFSPISNLGLMIIDEEHDLSFKQQDSMRYHARDIAIKRAHQLNIPIILSSATPSLESFYNTSIQKSTLLTLTQSAKQQAKKKISIIDMRGQKIIDGLSEKALHAIEKTLSQGKQAFVFLNRRGFSPVLMCHQCTWIASCPNCTKSLTLHLQINKLKCHHCLYQTPTPHECPSCLSTQLLPIGTGTERLAEHLEKQFSSYRLLRVDRDTIKHKGELDEKLLIIDKGEADLIIGTQMLAKGHHFPKLSLVIIVDIDASFYSSDFRALERLGQLITQVSGRAGRESSGEVLLQTLLPNHPYFKELLENSYEQFLLQQLNQRQTMLLPPFTSIALIRIKGKKLNSLMTHLMTLKKWLETQNFAIEILGPQTAPVEKKANLYHCQLLIKANTKSSLYAALSELRQYILNHQTLSRLTVSFDVDCQDFS